MSNKLVTALPRIAITMGEPAGIGPELLVKIAQRQFAADLVVLANSELLQETARKTGVPLKLVSPNSKPSQHTPGQLSVIDVDLPVKVVPGQLQVENASTTLKVLEMASEMALNKQVDAIVTAPVHKANLHQVDSGFLGHTEFFAQLAGVEQVVMMLATNELRITLATTHIPLNQVSKAITQPGLKSTLTTIIQAFQQLQLPQLKIAVCGLNPHAGEDGLLGDEDELVIKPVIAELVAQGHSVSGPFPADTLFTPNKRRQYDLFLAMYHDQGLPVVKAFGFGECANVTLGLPYIRTSVDHGTALDIAAEYCADENSLAYAIEYAIQLAAGKLPQ